MRVADAVAQLLRREGTDILFGYPVNPLFDAAAEAGIRPIVVRQERTGIHMADATSRMSSGDRIGVFTMQHGPGAENAFGAVAQAFGDSVPILVLAAGYPRRTAQLPPNFSSADAYRPVAKWVERLDDARALPDVMRRAFARLRTGRPRPVVVEIPVDVFGAEAPDPLVYHSPARVRTAPDDAGVAAAATALRGAERPLIYAGQGVHYARAWEPLRRLAELLNAPVTTSLQGKSAFPEDHALSLGSGGRSFPGPVRTYLEEADVILAAGASLADTAYGLRMPRDRVVIHATADADDLHTYLPAAHPLLGDAALTLEALVAHLSGDPGVAAAERSGVGERIAELRAAWLDSWRPLLTSDEVPLSPYRVITELLEATAGLATVITHDAGSPRDQLSPFWVAREPLSYLGWGKTTQLGYGLGLAMGAKLARPDALCINVWGDAAIGMTGMDLETAARERIPILSVLLNNFSMAIELPVMPKSTEKYRATDISGHYADLARSLGLHSQRITTPDEIAPAIRQAIEATEGGTPALLEFLTAKELRFSTG